MRGLYSRSRTMSGVGLLLIAQLLTTAAAIDDWSFTSSLYTGTIKECSIACDKLYVSTQERMGIHLPSRDRVQSIKYRITKLSRDEDTNNQFKAEVLIIGDFAFLFIRTKTDGSANLNREWKSYYSLNVRAVITFKNGQVMNTNTRVAVTILDVNDAPPLFIDRSYTFEVAESADIFSTVGSVRATDADEGFNSEIYYSFDEWLAEFAVHPTNGDVYITRNLTTAGKRHYSNHVVAANRGGGRQTKVPITFNIVQSNDNSPQFTTTEKPLLNAYTPADSTVMLIKVLDADAGLNGEIQSVEIISVTGSLQREARSHFVLQPTPFTLSQPHAAEYQLKVARSLTQIGDQVNITIQAWDKGRPVRTSRTTIQLDIQVSSSQHSGEETVYLEIDEGLPEGTPLHYIAPPRDSIDATYRIVSDELDSFRIHSTSGVLFLKRQLDAERNYQTTLEVRLRAKLSVHERSEYVVRFIITVRDENDNSPVFATALEKPLKEDSANGTLVSIASANDDDAAENSLVTYSISNSEPIPFTINPFSGEIRLNGTVDYELGLRLYHIKVRASDRGTPFRRETEKVFTVAIENVNDNRPMFEEDKCDVLITKNALLGSVVKPFSALDLDADDLTYSLRAELPSRSMLQIDSSTGILTTTREVSSLAGSSQKYWITASDGVHTAEPVVLSVGVVDHVSGNINVDCTKSRARSIYDSAMRTAARMNPSTEEIILESSVYASNNHAPVFDNQFVTTSTQYSLPENLPVGSIVNHITASDQDVGYAGLIQYNIVEGNSLGHFAINGSTGALIVFAPLDRETISTYNLTVAATDNADSDRKTTTLSIFMTVLDANDNTPRFLSDSYFEAYVNETARRGTVVLRVLAQDDDIDNNGRIQYALITDTPYFSIDSNSGRIIVSGALDRETKDRHILEVKASDMAVAPDEVRFATTTVIIHISDVNDNAPVFMKEEFRVKVREDMPVGTVITNLVAQDADLPASGGEVSYRILKGVADVFSIDRNTGVVKLLTKLDYEFKPLYRLTVRARDNGTDPMKTTCQLIIEIIDVNENLHRPVFDKLAYEGIVNESIPIGSVVTQVTATDSDTEVSDRRLKYSIRRGSGLGRFTIDDDGTIRTATILDRETQSSYWLTVYAQDQGSVPLSSSVDVYVQVRDINDNAPEAARPAFYVSVSENSGPDLRIAAISAVDRDSTSDIKYSITGGNTQSLFRIEPSTGVLRTTRRALDRESNERHTLEITISDEGFPISLSSSVQVWITITDQNDNSPRWNTQGKITISVLRSHDIVKPVYRLVASDKDKGENGTVSYSIEDSADGSLWRINSVTGELYLRSTWPETNRVIITVKATDGGLDPRDNSIDVEIVLVNAPPASSAPPVIMPMRRVSQLETVEVFSVVDMVVAEDADSSRLWYSIEDGADSEGFPMFSIQPDTGVIEVAGNLDYEKKPEYRLNISATDGHNTAYTILEVTLANVNEFQPQFTRRFYNVTVNENVRVGTEIVRLTATDDDDDSLVYLLHSASNNDSYHLFGIDHKTGVISTLRALDHESNHLHELIVKVNDNAVKEYSDYAKVVINVEDHNDHTPRFVTASLQVRVYEMSVIGTAITQVQATDQDKGDNSRLQYSLQSGNVGYTFNIDPDLGFITLARTLDLDVRSHYELTVMANDMGSPSLSSTCIIEVWVTVADERPPSFESTFFTAELHENEPIGTFVIALSGESQSALTYEIINDDGQFAVNPNSGILTSNKVFDFEERSMYNITLSAADIVGHQVTLTLVVHIIDKNDNRPSFNQLMYTGHVSEGSQDGSVILTNDSVPLIMMAEDKDSNLNALLLYSIIESEARRYFTVDANTGAVRTSTTPDRELKSRFEFTVQVRDQGEESLSAANPARVVITIDDTNDSPPVFTQTRSQVTLLVPTYQGVIIHSARAVDPDLNTKLRYSITGGNAARRFDIEQDTGVVYVRDPKNLANSYFLTVKVTDGVHEVTCNITVNIQQTSRSGLVFTESAYSGRVVENRTTSQTVLIVLPKGLELGEPVNFELLNYRDVFEIGETSGVLVTKSGATLDREVKPSYEVIVRVQTSGRVSRLAQVPVTVNVTDINDNAPYFIRDQYYATASVNTARGTLITTITALDNDLGSNAVIRYEMSHNPENNIKINRRSGEVTAKRPLNDYANQEYTFIVTAHDQGEPSLSSQTTLTVKVYATSTPHFTQVVYESSIPENIPISSAVTTVSASSPNDNKIIYSITEGDPNNEFTVHFSTGTVRVNDDLDFDLRPRYRLKIRAVDVVTGDWSDAIVIINVQDVNDQKPSFGQLDYYKSVSEAVTVGSEVLTINASDADQGINSQLHYNLKSIDGENQDHLLFEVKEGEGGVAKIHTVSTLDHETNKRLDFIIVAMDGGNPRQSAESYVHIMLTDLNDNAPVFEEHTYSVTISDEVKKGQFVAMVAAIDDDESNEGELMYSIVHGNDGQAFTINQGSGSVYVSPFHQSTMFKDVYALNISVSDGIFTSFTSLTIKVNPANRHTPEFEAILYNFKVYENSTDELILGQVKATDEDTGVYGEITYSIVGDWLLDRFRIHPHTGDISVKRAVDREQRDSYMLPVMAQDAGGRTEFTTVYIVVEDINDHSPQFIATKYTACVGNVTTEGTEVLSVSAFDLDTMENAELDYSILTDTREITDGFNMDAATGKISLARDLRAQDMEKEFSFFVRVRDKGTPALASTALATVRTSYATPPHFPTEKVHIFIQELQQIGAEVTQVQALYTGEHLLRYRIRSGSSVRTNQPASFVIDSRGRITTITSLDRENQGVYELVVEVYTESVPELVNSMLVIISPIDSNDNPPSFTSNVYTVSIAENIPIASSVIQVSAFEADKEERAKVTYSFAPESQSFYNLFMIETNQGSVTSLVPLDREETASYEFYIQASDNDPRGALTSKAKVKLQLIDVNDCPPRFPHSKIIAAVNEDAPSGTIVVTIQAVDDDLPPHSTKMYYISGGNDRSHFRIKQTGEIFVSKALDRESIAEYHLEVSATDGVFVTSIMVMISILDANDNAPVCDKPMYTKVLEEDIEDGTFVLAMKASDRDEPNTLNSKITYSLRGEGASDFAIDSIRGDIRVHNKLDREKISKYQISGVASDGMGLSCVADIVFELYDVNDNSPVFDQSVYRHTLPEDSTNNTLLLRVTATDKDTGINRKVDYSILSGATDMFAIDPNNGIVRLIKPLRDEDKRSQSDVVPSYTVIIAAKDRGVSSRTGTAQLIVRVDDVNDPPYFSNALYNKTVSEDVEEGTMLLRVGATSKDKGLNNVISYRISNGGANNQLFSINNVTGELSTNGRFDYELVREYVLNIEAKDAGNPPLSDMCMVTVYITDANDHKPTFAQSAYSASIREDAKIGDQVMRIEAQDLDTGLNAQITYSIMGGDDLHQFSIDRERGYISVAAPLDREAISVYRVRVQATDKGSPRQSSNVVIIISITDINDNPPIFSRTNYTGQIQEGLGAGYSPLTLTVTDADDTPNNGPFRYEILNGDPTNQFTITGRGKVIAHGTFDMKVKKEFLLHVRVDDSGVPPLSSTTFVRLEVHEAILHPPIVVSPRNFTVVAYEDTFPGGIIGHVSAMDPDFDKLEYKLVSPQYQRMFSMDPDTGAFSSYSLDASTYVLNVSVTDTRFTRYGVVEVNVVSITDEMMAEAVGVKIKGITDEEFVSVHRRAFENALLALTSNFRRIHVLSITEDPVASSSRVKRGASNTDVLVLVAAESSSGEMISKDSLASHIRDHKETVKSIMGGLDISLPVDDFHCSPTMNCNDDESCELQYEITQGKVTIHSEQQSFVSLQAKAVERCVCLGPTCINPCSANPCPRYKHCVPGGTPQSYSCECPTGTFGEDCELHSGSPMAFNGASYTRWTLVNDIKTRLQVKLKFKTKQADAVLMDARGDRDYSTLRIVDGYLQYTFECGSGPAVLATKPKINDGNWHNVTLERNGNYAQLLLDNKYPAQGESDRGTAEINLLDNNVHFGAEIKTLSNGDDIILSGFKGCMKEIQIDRVSLPYTGSNEVGGDAQFHSVLFECHECSINPCLNGGTCVQTGSAVSCTCNGYTGARCETDIDECVHSPCSSGSTCVNTRGSSICICLPGKTGSTCHQPDMCLSNPCSDDGVCRNLDPALGRGAFTCDCKEGEDCEVATESIVDRSLTMLQIIYIAGGCFLLFIVTLVTALVVRCVVNKRSAKKNNKMVESTESEREAMYYPENSQARQSQELYQHHRAPSPAPPSVPPRPASYTPSVNESSSKGLQRNYDLSHDYGSAADGLDRMGNMRDYRDVNRGNHPRMMSTFAGPKLTPPPPSVSDTDSIKKPGWDFDEPSSERMSSKDMMSSGRGSDRPSRHTVVAAVPHHIASRAGSKAGGSRNGSKPASITNGSFTSIPQEDQVSLASLRSKPSLHTAGRGSRVPHRSVAKDYLWDTSDWVPMREDGALPDIRGRDRDGYPLGAARLLSMSEVDDSEYVEDSELDDDVIPPISAPSYNADAILALQAQYKLEYDLPELHVPKPDRNHYLPRHGAALNAERRNPGDLSRALIDSPAVPLRSASLSYSTDEIAGATADELAGLGGYTSMEAGDSQSELSENICDIESDCEAEDLEGIISRVKNKTSSEV